MGCLVAILAVFVFRVGVQYDYTPDDTYIYLQYARNVIAHHEVAFNQGEPSYGVTSPLWLGLISVTGLFGDDLLKEAKVLDLSIAVAAILALFLLQRFITGSVWVALGTIAALSTHIWFLRWAGSGMESSLAAFLSIVVIYLVIRRSYRAAAVCSALLTLVRPEAAILVLTTVAFDLILLERGRSGFRTALVFAGMYALVLLPWYIYAQSVLGSVIPNTALAKSGIGFAWRDIASTAVDLVKTVAASDGIAVIVIVLTIALVLSGSTRRSSRTRLFSKREFTIPLVWSVTLVLLYSITSANVVSRYLLLMCPMIILLAFALPVWYVRLGGNERHGRMVMGLLTALFVVFNVFVFQSRVLPHMQSFAAGMRDCFMYIGVWLHENTEANATVLAGDIGAVGYYSQRRICDSAGLISRELLPFARKGYRADRLLEEASVRKYCNAGYVVERTTAPHAVHSPFLEPLFTRAFTGLGLTIQDTSYITVYKVRGQ